MATQVAAAYVEIGAKISGLQRGLKQASAQVDGFAGAADKSAARTGAKFQALGARMSSVGRKMTLGLTLPIVGVGVAAFKAASDFERSMSKITGLVGIARGQVAQMRKGVLDLSKGTGKSAAELADGLFVITSAGLRGKDAMDALNAAGKASTAGLGQTNDIARSVAGAMNAYGSSVLDAGKATDIIVATARAGNFETSQLAAALGRVLPFAKQAGASLEQVGGAVALLTRTNGNAAESITQITALMRAFVVPTEEGKKILSEMGTSAGDVRDIIAKDGLVAALQTLDKGLGGNREQLGRLLGSSEAAGAAFQLLDADAQTLNDTFGTVGKSAGMTDDAFAAAADTAQFKMEQAMAALQASLIELGGSIAPVVSAIAAGISKVVGAFTSLPGPVKSAVAVVGAFVAALGPILWMGGKVAGAIGGIKIAMAGMGAASAGTAAMGAAAGGAASKVGLLGAAMPLLANPLGLTVAAVGLGVGALFMFRNELDHNQRAMQGLTESSNTYAQAVRQVNTDYRAQVAAVGELNTSNAAATQARQKHTAAVQAYIDAVAAGKGPQETDAQYLERISGLRLAAAQANVAATTATGQNTEAVRKAVDGAAKLTDNIKKESDAARERLDRAKQMTSANALMGKSDEARSKAQAELADATANANLVEARRASRLKEVVKQQIATRDAVKKSSMTDQEKAAALDVVNRNINRTRTELKKLDGTKADPKITADTSQATLAVDTIRTALGNLNGKVFSVTVKAIKQGFNFGGMVGFAGGGTVRGPGGTDRVPAMLTAGEVVLTKRQQALVNSGMNIRDALRKTGGGFAKGGFVAPKRNKGESSKDYAKRVKAARSQWRQGQMDKMAPIFQQAADAYTAMGLAKFDEDASKRIKAIEREFSGSFAAIDQRLAGDMASIEQTMTTNLASIRTNFKGTFKQIGVDASGAVVELGTATAVGFDAAMKAFEKSSRAAFRAFSIQQRNAQAALSATFDALTPAEQRLKDMESAAQGASLQGALADARAQLADAQKWGDTEGIAEAQKAMREAERNIMVAELQKTAEAERAQREQERQAAQDDFDATWEEKRASLQEALDGQREQMQTSLDGQLEAERAAAEQSRILAQQRADTDRAITQQQMDDRIAAQQTADAIARVQREQDLKHEGQVFMARRKMFIGNTNTIIGIVRRFAGKLERQGKSVGQALADGLAQAGAIVKTEAKNLAKVIEDYLKTGSPTKKGPMSTLDKWWGGVAPALVDGIDSGAMESGVAKAAALEGAVALSGSRMSAAGAGAVINLTVTDNTLAGMSRDQADRVARDIQAALDRQVRIAA